MKYMIKVNEFMGLEYFSVITTVDDINFTSFPAEAGNPNYDAFLVQVDLTDEEVKALPTDEWIEA